MRFLFVCIVFFISLFLGVSSWVVAQTESDQRPLLNVQDGLGFSKDSVFSLNMRFRMQNRLAFWSLRDDVPESGIEARIRRLRLRFDGFLGSPKLAYYIQLSFSRADQDLVSGVVAQTIRDAMVYYFFDDNFYIGFGQSKLPGNRQRVISSGNIHMPERSLANNRFTIDRDFGVFAYKTIYMGEQLHWKIRTAISSGEGRNSVMSDVGLAYTARVELLPFGRFKNTGDYSEGDLEFEPKPKLSLATTYSFNHRAVRQGGQIGSPLSTPVDIQTFIADMMFKFQGWAFMAEFFDRKISGFTIIDATFDELMRVPIGLAYNLQLSRMLNPRNEIILRYTAIKPPEDRREFQPELYTKAIGFTHYFNKHRIKSQFYVGLDDRQHPEVQPLPFTFENRLQIIFQVEFGI
ncbi:MAG: porin [Bernardetiaceae bacterium]|nr:porin [Bernardetiaceae bacterium]